MSGAALALLLVAAQDDGALLATAASRLSAIPPQAPEPGRYRIDATPRVDDDKERALGTTGGQCQVVGARMCTRPPRTWWRGALPR